MSSLRSLLLLLALPVITQAFSPTADAGIIISIDNATVTPGDLFTLDVRVQGDGSYNILTERLDFFIGAFRIAPVRLAPAGGVTFDDPQVNGFDTAPDYVFFNNTFGLARDVTTDSYAQDTLTISDGTFDFLGVDVTDSFLLARLELTANPALLDITQYQVSLVEDESQFQTPPDIDFNIDDISFSSTGGLITINGPPSTAVPEPSSLLVCVCLAAGLLRRGFRNSGTSDSHFHS